MKPNHLPAIAILVLNPLGAWAQTASVATPPARKVEGTFRVFAKTGLGLGVLSGANYAKECDPLKGIEFSIGLVASEFFDSATTDAAGKVAFDGLGSGTYVIAEGIPGDFNRIEVFCAAPGETEPRDIESDGVNRIEVELGAGEMLSCDWYNIPADARGDDKTPTPTPPVSGGTKKPSPTPKAGEPVTRLPNTGGGAGEDGGMGTADLAALLALALGLGATGVQLRRRQA